MQRSMRVIIGMRQMIERVCHVSARPREQLADRITIFACLSGRTGHICLRQRSFSAGQQRTTHCLPREEHAFVAWLFRTVPADDAPALARVQQTNRELLARMTALGGKRYREPRCAPPKSLLPLGLSSLQLHLPTENGAPILVLGDGHAALHADAHALHGRWRIRREEPLEKRHSGSPGYSDGMLSVRSEPRPGYTRPHSDGSPGLDRRIRQRVGRGKTASGRARNGVSYLPVPWTKSTSLIEQTD